MAKQQKSKISYFQSNITATVSVALVLILIGVTAFLGLSARTMSRELKENMGFSIVLKTDATDADIAGLKAIFAKAPYVAKTTFISKDQALEQWKKDTGENLVETFGVNPLSAEFQVNVKANYAEIGKLKSIQAQLMHQSGVEDIALYETEVETTNKNIGNITIVLLFVAALLVFISFALINNTVRLTVYSRRFLIHTMKLVGAKPGFIRRPFVVQNMLNGLIAAAVACLVFVGSYFAAQDIVGGLVGTMFNELEVAAVFVGLALAGVVICGIAAFFAANKYIHLNYDDLFKRYKNHRNKYGRNKERKENRHTSARKREFHPHGRVGGIDCHRIFADGRRRNYRRNVQPRHLQHNAHSRRSGHLVHRLCNYVFCNII